MRYISTRGAAPPLAFSEVLLTGLARDGGLYVPEDWPRFSGEDIRALAGLTYSEAAFRVMAPFVVDDIGAQTFAELVEDTYAGFSHPAVAPLKELRPNEWLMELFHGPTLAFKDYAMQLLGRLFDHVLRERGEKVTVVGATSGDTGSAAIEACRDRAAIEIFILHPRNRISEVQRRQMTTVGSANVHNIAIEGSFDDCQDLVKGMFGDRAFRDEMRLAAFNSINWARILGQIVYYFVAGAALGAPARSVAFSVPTGNFGNIYAGYVARCMGLPVDHLVLGTNRNDILARFLSSGAMTLDEVRPTLSVSMDIQVASNFERLLFDLFERDGEALAREMRRFRDEGVMQVSAGRLAASREIFDGHSMDDEETLDTIAVIYRETGELLDPHTAIGVAGARRHRRARSVPIVSLANAHPAKFPEAVERATGVRPALPDHLLDLFERPESVDFLPNDLARVQAFVRGRVVEKRVA